MELQRTRVLLLLSLFVVGMFLYSHWQQKYMAQPTQQTEQSQTKASAHSDIPQDLATIPQNALDTSQQPTQTKGELGTLVHVHTDVLNVKIDTKGGDIVYAHLPQYPISLESPDEGYQLLNMDSDRYYVAQTGLIGLKQNGPDSKEHGRGQFSYQNTKYQLENNQEKLIVPLKWEKSGIEIIKTFFFEKGKYLVKVQYEVKNKTNAPWVGSFYGQIKREKHEKKNGLMGVQMYQGGAVYTEEKPYKKISYSDMKDAPFNQKIKGGWAAMLERYFLCAWIPDVNAENKYYTTADKDIYGIGSISTFEVLPGETKVVDGQLYMGPEITDDLKQISPGLELTVDYGILWPISQLLFWLLKRIHEILGNWGWAIIALTFLIKLAFYKLSAKSYTSMAHMKAVQPKIDALKARCGEDKQQFSQGLLALYKQEKVNPLGGCLPILIQIPVFIALYYVLLESVELRQAPFIFWIKDLSIKDPFYVLPLIMGASMFLQQKMNPPPPDPMQAKVMMAMPIVFTVLFLSFPSGLVLYWVANNILSMLQQWYIQRKFGLNQQKPHHNHKNKQKALKPV